MVDEEHIAWMKHALRCAEQAQHNHEVPVGAVVVLHGEIVGWGANASIACCDPSAHAEVMALRDAAQRLRNYRLVDTSLYVTLEPCIMCAGAIIQARVRNVIFGAFDPKTGAAGSVFSLLGDHRFNHRPQVLGGVLEADCAVVLTDFFRNRR
jgi:tRNA(adenine34) deaminase